MAQGADNSTARAASSAPWRAILRRIRARRSLIIAHHGVGHATLEDDPFHLRVPTGRLRTQIELLLDAGFEFVTVEQFVRRANGGEPPPGMVAMSFDDGMEDNHSILLPLLREYGITATIYIPTGYVGKPNPFMGEDSRETMMTADQLRDLVEAGVELGAHTVTHPHLEELDEEACFKEMVDGRDQLEELTGVRATTFAYPFCTYGPEAVRAAERAGFEAAVTCDHRGGWQRFEFQRAMMRGTDPLPIFVWKVSGTYWKAYNSAPVRVGRKATRGARKKLRAALASRQAA